MVGGNLRSRSNRRRKKRKNNRNLMIVLALAFLFFTILLSLIVLNKNEDTESLQEDSVEEEQVNETEKKETNDNETDTDENKEEEAEEEQEEESESDDENEEESSASITELEPEEIEDSNVKEAYVGDWSPTGTSQSGSHTTNYQNGSQDRMEIKKAASAVTDIAEDNMEEWRVENGGDENVIATVSNDNETEYYRVYLTWVDNKGWQVNKLEELEQNDKK